MELTPPSHREAVSRARGKAAGPGQQGPHSGHKLDTCLHNFKLSAAQPQSLSASAFLHSAIYASADCNIPDRSRHSTYGVPPWGQGLPCRLLRGEEAEAQR